MQFCSCNGQCFMPCTFSRPAKDRGRDSAKGHPWLLGSTCTWWSCQGNPCLCLFTFRRAVIKAPALRRARSGDRSPANSTKGSHLCALMCSMALCFGSSHVCAGLVFELTLEVCDVHFHPALQEEMVLLSFLSQCKQMSQSLEWYL